MPRPSLLLLLLPLMTLAPALPGAPLTAPARVSLGIDVRAPGAPFPHFWEQMFGSGRAALGLRADYLEGLQRVRAATGFGYVRAHAIFHDELGLYDEDAAGNAAKTRPQILPAHEGALLSIGRLRARRRNHRVTPPR